MNFKKFNPRLSVLVTIANYGLAIILCSSMVFRAAYDRKNDACEAKDQETREVWKRLPALVGAVYFAALLLVTTVISLIIVKNRRYLEILYIRFFKFFFGYFSGQNSTAACVWKTNYF